MGEGKLAPDQSPRPLMRAKWRGLRARAAPPGCRESASEPRKSRNLSRDGTEADGIWSLHPKRVLVRLRGGLLSGREHASPERSGCTQPGRFVHPAILRIMAPRA